MFRKNAIIENFYDHAYKVLRDKLLDQSDALSKAIHTYRIKEIKVRLFPEHTESHSHAVQELKTAQQQIWLCKFNYINALKAVQEYYTNNHQHFVVCKDYADPNTDYSTVDEIIERIIAREF